jgi:hypothetical protein
VLVLLRTFGVRLTEERLPDGLAKIRILLAVDRAGYLPLRAVLRFLRVSPSQFHAWRRRQRACALDDQYSCPRTSPSRLTPPEVRAIKAMVRGLREARPDAARLAQPWLLQADPRGWNDLITGPVMY